MGERWIFGLPLDGCRAPKAQLRRKKAGGLAPTCYVFNVCALRLAPSEGAKRKAQNPKHVKHVARKPVIPRFLAPSGAN